MKRLAWGMVALLLFGLGGCGWLWPPPGGGFPKEILGSWEKEIEAPIYSDALPEGGSGALGAVWSDGDAWLWAEVIAFPDPDAAHVQFTDETATLPDGESSDLGDEGVTLTHESTGLVLEFFRTGACLVLVGSLAASPELAPVPEEIHAAAEGLNDRIPAIPEAESGAPPEETCTPPDETPSLKVTGYRSPSRMALRTGSSH